MTERPILFQPSMVRAILAGTKTQTRRIISPQPFGDIETFDLPTGFWVKCGREYAERCPYGRPGGALWVREAWCRYPDGSIGYAADYPDGKKPPSHEIRWRPSIHLKRADARLCLRIKTVEVERLQEMSAHDAIAEGVELELVHRSGVTAFQELWDSINGGNGRGFPWRSNPFVWVLTFKRELQ